MSDIIQLLPDSVANQIAAGEVIQRPASAVKELLENSVDAGSSSIKLVIKDAGKTLIQVIDNGCGMSDTDARMCFERHATSKIKKADDLFNIRTMGFRGEALASIAAVAHVELKTKLTGNALGTKILIEDSEVKSQEQCSCSEGTSISLKNLFYNIPARRNFLKTNAIETKHIIDEFQRIGLSHPSIAFSLHHNGMEVFHLTPGSIRQRIVQIYGTNYNERLVPIKEETSIINLNGFIGKPEFAKRTRGEQFFFVNNRFIRDAYLNHALQGAYEGMIPSGSFPPYFIFIEIDSQNIDINIHPTKNEVKFQDEKSIYAILRSSIKRSLGQYNIAPSLDFEQETSFNIPVREPEKVIPPTINFNPNYNPFEVEKRISGFTKPTDSKKKLSIGWEKLYEGIEDNTSIENEEPKILKQQLISPNWEDEFGQSDDKLTYQLHNKYIIASIKSGFMIIDQQAAHERILYEKYFYSITENQGLVQQELFPQTIEFSPGDFEIIKELEKDICALGFDIRELKKNSCIIHGIPSDIEQGSEKEIIEDLIEQYKFNVTEFKIDKRKNLAKAMARNLSVKSGKTLTHKEMKLLIDTLFGCKMPYKSPSGKNIIVVTSLEELAKKFEK